MKKVFVVLLTLSMLLLAGCSGEEAEEPVEGDQAQETISEDQEESDSLEVDKNLLSVEVTIPASLIVDEEDEEVDIDLLTENAKEEGFDQVELNDDGSVSYTMSKAKHKKLMEEMEDNLATSIDEVINNEEYPSIKDVIANNTFSEYDVIVNRNDYESSFDGFGVLGIALESMLYQSFDGVDPDDYEVIVNLIDESTEETFDSIVYPDAFDE